MPAGYPKPYTPHQGEAMQQAVQRIKDKLCADDTNSTKGGQGHPMRVLHITPETIPERKPVLDRIAEMERKLLEPKQRTILAPFRMPGVSTADGYYGVLRALVDEGKLTTTTGTKPPHIVSRKTDGQRQAISRCGYNRTTE